MSLAVIVQFAALAVVLVVGVLLVYVIFEMRTVYADHRDKFLRAISAVEQWQRMQPEFVASVRQLESDTHALQERAAEIQRAVADLTAAIREFHEHTDGRDGRITQVLESISENLRTAPQIPHAPQNGDFVRLRREVLKASGSLRFAVLKDWVSINVLAILRRASRQWRTAQELIAGIPEYLEPEAEVVDDELVLIGTRGHAERLAIPVRELDPSCGHQHWFERRADGTTGVHVPAVILGSEGSFELLQKGSISAAIDS